jgi:prephenate dehydrogenase
MKIGIIGGNGVMGKIFQGLFKAQGIQYIVSDLGGALKNEEVISEADIIVFSLPISSTVSVIEELAPLAGENQMFVDLTSVKVAPVNAMLKSKAEVLGLHPLFGAGLANLKGQTVVSCPVRIKQLTEEFLSILRKAGILIKELTPQKHDELMSVVQGLNHLSAIIMAKTLSESGIGLAESTEYGTPVFKIRSYLLSRLMSESPSLYADISLCNPNTQDIMKELKKNTEELGKILENKDREAFINYFASVSAFFSETNGNAVENSNKLIDYVSKL